MTGEIGMSGLSSEISSADFGDRRLAHRLQLIVRRLWEQPSSSFPQAMATDAELEATYRFLSNERVSAARILEPHHESTAKRVSSKERVVVVHDTTEFEFGGEVQREGLGRLIRPGQGFFGHFALAVSASCAREPLGVLGLETIFRLDEPVPNKARKNSDNRGESARWHRLVRETEQRCGEDTQLIHVMDREGDSYLNLGQLELDSSRFVIRSSHDRCLAESDPFDKLREAARSAEVRLKREVKLSPRKKHPGPKSRRFPPRKTRTASLNFAARRVVLPRPRRSLSSLPEQIAINVVHVLEIELRDGNDPVEWILLTNLPIETKEDIEFVVDCYRNRWLIEEFFKALKTGCKYESRQLGSALSLLNALAIFVRHLAQNEPELPATSALSNLQLQILQTMPRAKMPKNPTVKEALFAVAALGGHLKRNGNPGWLVLRRGFHDLMLIEQGWRAAVPDSRCDQS